jgi:hypothetical protein
MNPFRRIHVEKQKRRRERHDSWQREKREQRSNEHFLRLEM